MMNFDNGTDLIDYITENNLLDVAWKAFPNFDKKAKTERQGLIDGLVVDDLNVIVKDLIERDDPEYLLYLLEFHGGYASWTDEELRKECQKRGIENA